MPAGPPHPPSLDTPPPAPAAVAGEAAARVSLVLMRENPAHRRRFELTGPSTSIGRREECDLRIPLGDVSRKHCAVLVGEAETDDGPDIRLQDLGSSNGTYVNGRRVQESPLLAGDVVQIGSLKFLVQVDGEPAEPSAVVSRRPVAGTDQPGQAEPLSPTAQADVATVGLDPSDAAGPLEELMRDD